MNANFNKNVDHVSLATILSDAIHQTILDYKQRVENLSRLEAQYLDSLGLNRDTFNALPDTEKERIKEGANNWLKSNV